MNICLFEKDPETCQAFSDKLRDNYPLNQIFENSTKLQDHLDKGENIDILFCNPETLTPELEAKLSHVAYIIALTSDASPESMLNALSAGARDIVTYNTDKETLLAAVQKGITHINVCNQITGKKSANIITFISSKGGIGKSVICANLAATLQKHFRKSVLLIDTVQRFGSGEILLNFSDKKSIANLPLEVDSLDAYWQEMKENILIHNSGLNLLYAGDENGEPLPPLKLKSILNTARDKYDFILIDTDNYFVEPVLSLLELSDQIIYLSKMDIASLKNLRLGLDSLKSFYFSLDKVKLVINCFERNSELSTAELEKFLSWKVFAVLPEDRQTIISSINKGVPFVCDKTDGDLFKAMKQFAKSIQNANTEKEKEATGANQWLAKVLSLLK